MKGVEAYDCSGFHPNCPGVQVVAVGGFAHLWCPTCKVLCRLEAAAPKFQSLDAARYPKPPVGVPNA